MLCIRADRESYQHSFLQELRLKIKNPLKFDRFFNEIQTTCTL